MSDLVSYCTRVAHTHTHTHTQTHINSRCGGQLNYFQQMNLFASESNEERGLHNFVPNHSRISKYLRTEEGAKPSPDSIKTTMSPHQRHSVARSSFSQPFKQKVTDNTTEEPSLVQNAQDMMQGDNSASMSVSNFSSSASCIEQLLSASSSSTPSSCLGSDVASPSNSAFSSQLSPLSQSLSSIDSPSTMPLSPSQPPVWCHDNGSNGSSSPVGSTDTICSTQEDFDPNQFCTSNNSFTLSLPPEIYNPHNCSNSTFSPASANLVEMDALLNSTTVNTNSIPSQSSVLFPDSHTPGFVPQLHQNSFNLQILPSFNFSDSSNFTHSSNLQSSEFYPNVLVMDTSTTCVQTTPQFFNCSNQTINPEDDIIEQILNDMTGDCNSIPDVSLSTDLSFGLSHSYPQSDFNVQNAHLAHSAANTHSQTQSNSIPNELLSQSPNNVDSQSSIYSYSTLATLMV